MKTLKLLALIVCASAFCAGCAMCKKDCCAPKASASACGMACCADGKTTCATCPTCTPKK